MYVHFVGSVALDSPRDFFSTAGPLLPQQLKRIPDGEPGGRRLWTTFQLPVLRAHPDLAPVSDPGSHVIALYPLKLADGVRPEELHFGELGYAREARASYQDLLLAREIGQLPSSVRFQVSLPTPGAVINLFCTPQDAPKILPAYERAMLREVDEICAAIPHHDLALQWDMAVETLQWDGRLPLMPRFPGIEQVFRGTVRRLSERVPADVELGFHLCYGDLDGVHMIEPADATRMVELTHLILDAAGRPVQFVHMPVPIDRDDDAYFEPLQRLRLPAGTELYLGLVHAKDGVDGTRRRIEVASRYVPEFGIGSECGISRGRRPRDAVEFIRVYAGATAAQPSRSS